MKNPMKVQVISAEEREDNIFYQTLAMMIVAFYERNPEYLEHPEWMAQHEPETKD